MAAVGSELLDNKRDEMFRPYVKFPPSPWGDRFASMIIIDDQTVEKWNKEVEELKAEVRSMVTDPVTAVEEKLCFIDTIEHLGISYLFDNEIEQELEKIFLSCSSQFEANGKHHLSIVSLYFRLLRQHGFRISSDIFDGFKDKDGFKNIHRTDVKGLLNLYEAAHTRIHGEDILEEALAFATTHLKLMLPHMPPTSLTKHVSHALVHSIHKGISRFHMKIFISLYEEEAEESKNYGHVVVLRLAKLDFNLVQILHRKELVQVSSWWKDLVSKFPYAKDRAVENYLWVVGVYFEPKYSIARIMLGKLSCLAILLDDTYDSYGTVDELKVFTEAVQRWDISEIDRLPEYMKTIYKTLLQLYDSFEEEQEKLGMSYAVTISKESMKELTQSFYIEAKWFLEGFSPSFEEYLENGMITAAFFLLMSSCLLGVESATKEEFEWLKSSDRKILIACSIIARLVNDIASYEIDKKKGQITSGIDFYMKQYGVTKVEATEEVKKMVENAWKDLNEGCLRTKTVSAVIQIRVLNLARLIDITYKHNEDSFTNPRKNFAPHIIAMFVDSFEI